MVINRQTLSNFRCKFGFGNWDLKQTQEALFIGQFMFQEISIFAYFQILTSKLSILILYKIMQHYKVAKTE